MIPVFQTQFVKTHGKGNCVQAAVASILDLPLDDVPAFRDLPADQCENAIDAFLQSRKLRRISIRFGGGFEWGDVAFHDQLWHPLGQCHVPGPPVLIYGQSPRSNTGHAVVGQIINSGFGWRLLHDPHPDGNGINGNPKSIHWIVPLAMGDS